MTEQLKDGDTADARSGQMLLQWIVEIQQTLVAQPQNQHGGEGLGEGADPELRIGVRGMVVDAAAGSAPDDPALTLHRGDE